MKKLTVLGVLISIFCSFRAAVPPACQNIKAKQVYEENLRINIERCVKASVNAGKDSAEASRRCRYALERAFELDSTFYKMNYEEQQKFIECHRNELMIE